MASDEQDPQSQQFLNTYMGQFSGQAGLIDQASVSPEAIPTQMLPTMTKQFYKSYMDLISPKYLANMRDNISAGGRRSDTTLDSHMHKMMHRDDALLGMSSSSKTLLVSLNQTLTTTIANNLRS